MTGAELESLFRAERDADCTEIARAAPTSTAEAIGEIVHDIDLKDDKFGCGEAVSR